MHPHFAGGGCAALVSSLCSTVYITAEARTAEFYNGGRLRRLGELVIEFNRLLYREVQTAEYY